VTISLVFHTDGPHSYGKFKWGRRVRRRKKPVPGDRRATGNGREKKTAIDIGEQIRELRRMRGLTQAEAAENSGLAMNTLSLTERGLSSPTVSTP
jgi:transcriptional regulator with XRE-family HTH domain